MKWWRFWWLWGILENREVVSCEVVKSWSWNILLFEEFLHYAALRSEWQDYVFCSRLGIWIIFETQRFFIILVFLRKQSWNSLANWWSVYLNILYFSRITNPRDRRFSVLSFYFIFKNVSTEWLMEIIFFSPTLASATLSHRDKNYGFP